MFRSFFVGASNKKISLSSKKTEKCLQKLKTKSKYKHVTPKKHMELKKL